MFAAPVKGTKPFAAAVARARPLPGSLIRTWPETTCTFTDLPGTGGGSGANVTVTIWRGSVFTSQTPLPSRSTKAVSVSVPTFAPSQLMSAVPSAPVVTAPEPGLTPVIV